MTVATRGRVFKKGLARFANPLRYKLPPKLEWPQTTQIGQQDRDKWPHIWTKLSSDLFVRMIGLHAHGRREQMYGTKPDGIG